MSKHYLNIIIVCYTLLFFSCKKFSDVGQSPTELSTSSVFANGEAATSAITGIYSRMISSNGFASGSFASISALAGASADELINYSPNSGQAEFANNSLSITNDNVYSFMWSEPYQYIYTCNDILAALDNTHS